MLNYSAKIFLQNLKLNEKVSKLTYPTPPPPLLDNDTPWIPRYAFTGLGHELIKSFLLFIYL